MRFECNCETDVDLSAMLDEVHKAETGYNFEIGARLWYTPEGLGKTILVEFDVTTQDCRDVVENQDEPDWFTAYEVSDEQDYDCSKEIFTEPTDNYISVSGLKEAMTDFVKEVFQKFYDKENERVNVCVKMVPQEGDNYMLILPVDPVEDIDVQVDKWIAHFLTGRACEKYEILSFDKVKSVESSSIDEILANASERSCETDNDNSKDFEFIKE